MMGREEEREILSGSKPDHAPQVDLDAATGDVDDVAEVPEPDRRGKSEDDPVTSGSAFARGDPDAVPTDVTDTPEYQDELAEVRREVKDGEAVLEDGREQTPPTSYEGG
jgi:hypothetical protein